MTTTFEVRQILGDRARQEDFYGYQEGKLDGGSDLMIVADGMGGHAGGDVASRVVVQAFMTAFSKRSKAPIPERLRRALDEANLALAERVRAEPDLEGMGSTLVAAVVNPNGLYWISVGDSPFWRLGTRGFERLNEDHSMVGQMVANGQMTEAEAARHAQRNQILSSVDGSDLALVDCPATPLPLNSGDLLLLASDGVETLSPGRIMDIARRSGPSADAIADAIVSGVRDANKPRQDNVTLLVRRITQTSIKASGTKRILRLGVSAALALLLTAGGGIAAYWLGWVPNAHKTDVAPAPGPSPVDATVAGQHVPSKSGAARVGKSIVGQLQAIGAKNYALVVRSGAHWVREAQGVVDPNRRLITAESKFETGKTISRALTAVALAKMISTPNAKVEWPIGWSIDGSFRSLKWATLSGNVMTCNAGSIGALRACLGSPRQQGTGGRHPLMQVLLASLSKPAPKKDKDFYRAYVDAIQKTVLKPARVTVEACTNTGKQEPPIELFCDAGWSLSTNDLAAIAADISGILGSTEPLPLEFTERREGSHLAWWSESAQDNTTILLFTTRNGVAIGLAVVGIQNPNLGELVMQSVKTAKAW